MTSHFTQEQLAQFQKRNSDFETPGNLESAAAHAPVWLVSSGPPLSDSQLSPCSGNASDNDDGTVRGTGSPGGIKNGRARYLEKNRVAQVPPPLLSDSAL